VSVGWNEGDIDLVGGTVGGTVGVIFDGAVVVTTACVGDGIGGTLGVGPVPESGTVDGVSSPIFGPAITDTVGAIVAALFFGPCARTTKGVPARRKTMATIYGHNDTTDRKNGKLPRVLFFL
jgi:hypothetical protein